MIKIESTMLCDICKRPIGVITVGNEAGFDKVSRFDIRGKGARLVYLGSAEFVDVCTDCGERIQAEINALENGEN